MSGSSPLIELDYGSWLQTFRCITRATDARTFITDNLPISAVGSTASVVNLKNVRTVASALILANMNSLPFDWAVRSSIGGTSMSIFIVKQLPVLPPKQYLENCVADLKYVELIVPRVLNLTYTSDDLAGFAIDLGFEGPPFSWDEDFRHALRCELDAIFTRMYGLNRAELEWILDASPPSSSFFALKRREMRDFGEYRTKFCVLQAFDMLERGELPNITPAVLRKFQ